MVRPWPQFGVSRRAGHGRSDGGGTGGAHGHELGCAAPAEFAATATADAQGRTSVDENHAAAAVPKVVFQLNKAEEAQTILRFVTNYLAVEPTAQVAVVGYAGGIDFMLQDARDPSGKPYADQVAALAARGVAFKVCNNTLKARNLTAAVGEPSGHSRARCCQRNHSPANEGGLRLLPELTPVSRSRS